MKKWLWAIPILLIVVAGVSIAVLNSRDIVPEDMVFKTSPEELDIPTPAQAVGATENAEPGTEEIVLADSDKISLVLTTKKDYSQKIKAYNEVYYVRDLGNGWTYVLEYTCDITFTDQYLRQLEFFCGETDSVVFYLRDKTDCVYPAEKSRGAYVVQAEAVLKNGEKLTAFLDPKDKVYIGKIGEQ